MNREDINVGTEAKTNLKALYACVKECYVGRDIIVPPRISEGVLKQYETNMSKILTDNL